MDLVQDQVQDIEQLVSIGKKLGTCPYYASRHAAADAQVTNFIEYFVRLLLACVCVCVCVCVCS